MAHFSELRGALNVVYNDRIATISSSSKELSLNVEYYDMRFKFEFFALKLCDRYPEKAPKQLRLEHWDRIAGIFRFEWMRRAEPGEFPPNSPNEGALRLGPGRRQDVPDSAFSIAVSMVGLVFYAGPKAALCITDDPMPTLIRVLLPGSELDAALANGDCVPLESIPSWIDELQGNPATRFKDVTSEEFQREGP